MTCEWCDGQRTDFRSSMSNDLCIMGIDVCCAAMSSMRRFLSKGSGLRGGQQSRSQVIGLGAQEYRVLEAMDERKTVAEIEQIASERGPQCDGASFIASMLELGCSATLKQGEGHDERLRTCSAGGHSCRFHVRSIGLGFGGLASTVRPVRPRACVGGAETVILLEAMNECEAGHESF
jgi:hypothetical protein